MKLPSCCYNCTIWYYLVSNWSVSCDEFDKNLGEPQYNHCSWRVQGLLNPTLEYHTSNIGLESHNLQLSPSHTYLNWCDLYHWKCSKALELQKMSWYLVAVAVSFGVKPTLLLYFLVCSCNCITNIEALHPLKALGEGC